MEPTARAGRPEDTDPDASLRVRGVSKKYCPSRQGASALALAEIGRAMVGRPAVAALRGGEFWALRDVSFDVRPGECLGVLGRNGSGKSTLLRAIAGATMIDEGRIEVRGRVVPVGDFGAGYRPELTGRENALAASVLHGASPDEARERIAAIAEFADIGSFFDEPFGVFSSGMRARVGFAVAVHADASVLLVDEALAVGDVGFASKCMRRMRQLLDGGSAILLVSHNLAVLQMICDRAVVLDKGRVAFSGAASDAIRAHTNESIGSADSSAGGAPAGAAAGQGGARLDPARPVRITGVGITGCGEATVLPGGEMHCVVRWTSGVDLRVRLWVRILNGDRGIPIGTVMLGGRREIRLSKGDGAFDFVVRNLPLASGRYWLQTAIGSHDPREPLAELGLESAPVGFDVVAPADEHEGIRRQSGDLVTFDVTGAD